VSEVPERVAFLEGRVEEQVMRIDDVREAVDSLERRIDRLEERVDRRFDSIDARLGRMNGVLIAMLLAIVGGMSALLAVTLQR
jgi:tetrahydromethanopterin S-methyltransferase subunit G